MRNYTEILGKGEENAIETSVLMKMLGFNSERSLRKDISKARKEGQIILSSAKGGYYLPKDDKEVKEWIKKLTRQASSIFYILKHARIYLRENKNQYTIDDLRGPNNDL